MHFKTRVIIVRHVLCKSKYCSVEVPNSNSISCYDSSLLECSPVTQATRVRFPAETCLSQGALVEDGDDLWSSLFIVQRYRMLGRTEGSFRT